MLQLQLLLPQLPLLLSLPLPLLLHRCLCFLRICQRWLLLSWPMLRPLLQPFLWPLVRPLLRLLLPPLLSPLLRPLLRPPLLPLLLLLLRLLLCQYCLRLLLVAAALPTAIAIAGL